MSLTVKSSGNGDFETTPEGTYIGRCIKVIDLGTQTTNGQFGTKSQKQIMITWELLDDEKKMQDGRPFSVSQFYTASLHEKAKLRKDLEAWRGQKFTETELEGFDLADVLGAYCMLQVIHSQDGQYANVNAIMSYKGEKPAGVNELVMFDISNPDMAVLDAFSDKMRTKITSTPEWQERIEQADIEQGAKEAFKKDIVDENVPKEMPKDFLKDLPA